MKSDRIALYVSLTALALAPLGVLACATADLIEAPPFDAGPIGVVSESGTDDASGSDAGDASKASDASAAADGGDAGNAADASADAGANDASRDASSQG